MKNSKILSLFLLAISIMACNTESQNSEKKSLSVQDIRVDYEVRDGKLHGSYSSFYSNGELRARGNFNNNCRSGAWEVFDANGNIVSDRRYKNAFEFENSLEESSSDGNMKPYKLERDPNDLYTYFPITEETVVWSKRIWRNLDSEFNPLLFKEEELWNIIRTAASRGELQMYSNESDEFLKRTDTALTGDLSALTCIGYQIKEENFFDSSRMLMESRIIGIAPIVRNAENQEYLAFWVYYPELRPILGVKKLAWNPAMPLVENMEDFFFFGHYSGQIIKESNLYDRWVSDYTEDVDAMQESDRIQISIIEAEHSQFVELYSKDRS